MVIKSGYFPRILGILLIATCFAYLGDLFVRFLAPDVAVAINPFVSVVAAVAELSFMAWLLVRGVRVPEPDAPVPAPAGRPGGSS